MNPTLELAALDSEREALLAKAGTPGDFTAEDAVRAEEIVKRMSELKEQISKSNAAVERLTAAGMGQSQDKPADEDETPALKGGIGDRFVASKAYKTFKTENPLPVSGKPVSIKSEGLGGFVAKASGDPAPLSSALVGAQQYQREAGIVDRTYPGLLTILDLVTRGKTSTPYFEFRTLEAITAAAKVVKEGELKPLSQLTTGVEQAIAHVIADGVKVTNQELQDDGVMAALLNSVLTRNLLQKIEDLLLNGTGTNEPKGILHTTGVLQQDFAVDAVTTIRKGITTLRETSGTEVQAILLSPEDDEEFDLLKDGNERFYGNGPFGIGPNTLWGRQRVVSSKLEKGTAIIGDFTAIHLLELQGVTIEAFNQNEDDARHNLTYVRAETRQQVVTREPARLLIADLSAPIGG